MTTAKARVSPQIERFWRDLLDDIRTQRIILPSLPEVAVRVRRLLERNDTTSERLTQLVSLDPILSSRLIRASNSPLARGATQIVDVKMAITRLGMSSVRNIVMSYAVEQLYTSGVDAGDRVKRRHLQAVWRHSVHVAALSHVLASRRTRLNPEQAMLAGLIHDIGKFPIIEYASCVPGLLDDERGLRRILAILHGRVGELVLRSWGFSEDLIVVVRDHERFVTGGAHEPGYIDIVTVANLLSLVGTDHPHCRLDWSDFSAFASLDLSPEESIDALQDAQREVQAICQVFAS